MGHREEGRQLEKRALPLLRLNALVVFRPHLPQEGACVPSSSIFLHLVDPCCVLSAGPGPWDTSMDQKRPCPTDLLDGAEERGQEMTMDCDTRLTDSKVVLEEITEKGLEEGGGQCG